MNAARNEVIARAFGGAAGENRGLVFVEAHFPHFLADGLNDFGAEHDVVVQFIAAQIEEAVFKAERLGRLLVLRDLERNLIGFAEDFHFLCNKFNLTCREFRIDRFLGSGNDRSGEGNNRFHAPFFQFLIEIHLRIDHDLGLSVVVAQINEDHAAVVAHAVNPACKFRFLSDIGLSESAACLRSECFHFYSMLDANLHIQA